MRVSPR
jgi:hypothetical protein